MELIKKESHGEYLFHNMKRYKRAVRRGKIIWAIHVSTRGDKKTGQRIKYDIIDGKELEEIYQKGLTQ